jgi:hypothetical protein
MGLKYLPHYVARVVETGLGDSGRNIKAESEFMPAEAGEIFPYLDGLIKFPPPAVDEFVLVIQADASNMYRWYHPIRGTFNTLTDNSDNIQLESAGNIDLEGTTISLGADATESAVLGDVLKQWLTDLNTAISAITVTGNIGVPTSPPINVAQFSALTAQLINILSTKVKVG